MTEEQYQAMLLVISESLETLSNQEAIRSAFEQIVALAPQANPSDIWRHVLMGEYIASGRNDNSWKKASGRAFEYAFASLYNARLLPLGLRLRVLTGTTALLALQEMVEYAKSRGVDPLKVKVLSLVPPSKFDLAIEGECKLAAWCLFGIAHCKTSIAERIKDDAPASRAIRDVGHLSILVTLDHKCYPPPHGDGINYGELGGRVAEIDKIRIKRDYVEREGDFDKAYSYNLRTPESPATTPTGGRIKTLRFGLAEDPLIADLQERWNQERGDLCRSLLTKHQNMFDVDATTVSA